MKKRLIFSIFLIFSGLCMDLAAKPKGYVHHVRVGHFPDADFRRISEYFTGRENTGWDCIVRSDPGAYSRAGLYWMVELKRRVRDLGEGAKVELEYYLSNGVGPVRQELVLDMSRSKNSQLRVGLTGKDWPGRDVGVVAWKLGIRRGDGVLVGSDQSFLWE